MDQIEDLSTEDAFEQLKSKHCKERKELQAKLTSLKHELTKNDKKRRKEVGQQCEQMETEMKRRHEREMAELDQQVGGKKAENETERGQTMAEQIQDEGQEKNDLSTDKVTTEEGTALFFKELKLTKTQLKKEKKRAEKTNARNKAEAEDAKNAVNSRGNLENEAIRQLLNENALELVEVSPDGDCLYSAMAHQANILGLEMRRMAADYILKHREDFLPFLADENSGTSEDGHFEEYCSKVARMCVRGGSWGGEPELRALSFALRCSVEVLHADGETIKFGEMFSGQPLIVTYHKFAYTLGEHYNSTKPIEFD